MPRETASTDAYAQTTWIMMGSLLDVLSNDYPGIHSAVGQAVMKTCQSYLEKQELDPVVKEMMELARAFADIEPKPAGG